jgi:cyclin G-associated kinase
LQDGKINSAFVIAAFLLYIGMFKDQKTANNFFSVQRAPISFHASQRRYLEYITKFNSKNKVDLFDSAAKIVQLRSIVMNGIPLFTKNRDGCRPIIEIFSGTSETCVFSTSHEYDDLRSYNRAADSQVKWSDLNVSLDSNADICIVISHARSGLGARVLQNAKIQTLRICSLQFNLALEKQVENGLQTLRFETIALDGIDTIDRYPREFQIAVNLQYSTLDSKAGRSTAQLTASICDPLLLFENQIEFEECKDTFNCQRPAYLINGALPKGNEKRATIDPLFDSADSLSDGDQASSVEFKTQAQIEADLLNLTLNSPVKTNTRPKSDVMEDSLFADFGSNSSGASFDLLNDIIGAADPKNTSPSNHSNGVRAEAPVIAASNDLSSTSVDLLEELFAVPTPSNAPKPDLLNEKPNDGDSCRRTSTSASASASQVHRNASTPNLLGFDPFDQLSGLSAAQSSANATPKHTPNDLLKPQKAQFSAQSTSSAKPEQKANTERAMPRVASLNAFSSNGTNFKPDYNRSFFTDNSKVPSNGTGMSGKVPNNAFDDLLKGFTKGQAEWSAPTSSNQPKSMAQLRKEEMLRNGTVDPLKMKVNEWKEGKKRNIRALLSTLHQIVWDDCNWIAIGMHQLIGPNDVKKMYRKACLNIHPDKLIGSPNEELAKLLFIELNDAWNEFEKQRT